ncbi:MAG: hypothetical protein RSC66_04640, partial [Comamonas sp.]
AGPSFAALARAISIALGADGVWVWAGPAKISAKKRGFFAEIALFLAGAADEGTKAGSFRRSPYI